MEKFGFCLFAPTECTKNICNGRDKRLTYFWVYYNFFVCVWGGALGRTTKRQLTEKTQVSSWGSGSHRWREGRRGSALCQR